ncbi:MAG: NTP transferase domain-containing protein [Lentisphaeria bacterium]|nr:NTP transferase domain-containing protein [Lentisphaeria bacterium]
MSSKTIPDYVIVLAAGKGSRMRSESCPKVCFKVNDIPAINRALQTYSDCGIPQAIAVVGTLAEKVMSTITPEFPNTLYAFQAEQKGTANAIRCALDAMTNVPDDAVLLMAAGDRIIAGETLDELFELYGSTGASLALLTSRCNEKSSQGRIVQDADGKALGIVEMADIRQQKVYQLIAELLEQTALPSKDDILNILSREFFAGKTFDENKAAKAFPALWKYLDSAAAITADEVQKRLPSEFGFRFGDKLITPDEARSISVGNTSVYMTRKGLIKKALGQLSTDNAQQEEYLSDLVQQINIIEPDANVQVLTIEEKDKILGFNDPGELLEVERILRSKNSTDNVAEVDAKYFRTLEEWQYLLLNDTPLRTKFLHSIYGKDEDIQNRQLQILQELLLKAQTRFSAQQKLLLLRSPGRLNVMGRHVDHQGGNCNLMTISFETVYFVSPRKDDTVTLTHCNENAFGRREFRISEQMSDLPWSDWNTVIESDKLKKMIREYGVDWSNYIQAAILRLQKHFPNIPLHGMDMVIGGNIPMAAGLSSSSSLLVGAAEAAVTINNLDIPADQLVDLCGEGEWFVGTRGGSADHAAVKLGQCGGVVKVKFFDFGIVEKVPFPEGYSMIVCNSGIKACKSSNAKDQFNHRISCYKIGFHLIKKMFPQYAASLQHLRDVSTGHLKISLSQIYKILFALPENATLPELKKLLPEVDLDAICSGHTPPADGLYPIRGVVLFGLAEMQRSAAYADALKKGDMEFIGKLMKCSHDGDRVARFDDNWRETPWSAPCDNAYIIDRLNDLESGDVDRVTRSQLIWQPGAYSCSLPEIDRMVDIAIRTTGVLGAQLAGAGLGGCMMILAKNEAIDLLRKNLIEKYYRPAGLAEVILVSAPIAGAGTVEYPETTEKP